MKKQILLSLLLIISILFGCNQNELEQKGFAVSPSDEEESSDQVNGISKDSSLQLTTRPSRVVLTGNPQFRLTTIYKVNFNDDSSTFIGSNREHRNYSEFGRSEGNVWNYNLIPGLAAVYGYNMVNVSIHNNETGVSQNLFEKPALIKTLYYPSFSKDTLNFKPTDRDYYMVSVYNEDTNKDRLINLRDLRRFYLFDVEGKNLGPLVPKNYSVYKSQFDPANDLMYVFAKLDKNGNGQRDELEPDHVFWVDLKNPTERGRLY